ncbi:MAG: EutN/CcmL family microcompartment protein [Salinivirgaceae bacterium]|nr:EutN/CcmL family microcompartment protein [Salinivirgaceae bacterium]
MKFGKVLGRVVSTVKVESFEGLKLLLVQPINEKKENTGDPIVAVDTIQCGIGEFVYYETSREAAQVIESKMNPCDTAIMGIIDEMMLEEQK